MSKAISPTPEQSDDEAERYGIKRVLVEAFEFGGYRYSSLKDAVAQAKRNTSGS